MRLSLIIVLLVVIRRSCEVDSDEELCIRENISCSYQLWKNETPENACQMTHIPSDAQECASHIFNRNNHFPTKRNLHNARLHTYIDEERNRVVLNVTFSNISWTTNVMRFVGKSEGKNICNMFKIWENVTVPKEAELNYSCPWMGTNDYDPDKTFVFEYEARADGLIDGKRYIFKMPLTTNLNSPHLHLRQVFAYVDFTDTTMLKLRIQPLPAEFGVTNYNVVVWRRRYGERSDKMDVRILSSNEAIDGLMHLDYQTWNVKGHYYFEIYFDSDKCPSNVCKKTYTPEIFIGRIANRLVIGIVGASVIIPVLMFAMYIWNKQHCKIQEIENTTKALLIYVPSTKEHQTVISTLVQTLTKVFGIEVYLDIFDIPLTSHKNPLIWCSEAFQQATHIIYVASPKTQSNYSTIYQTEPLALRFLEEELSKKISTKKICCVTFPYAEDIPQTLKNVRSFMLMKDFNRFINCLLSANDKNEMVLMNVFKRNMLMYYMESPVYRELMEAVKKAQKKSHSDNAMIAISKPNIKIVLASDENIDKKTEEKQSLIEKDEKNLIDINDLDLSDKECEGNKTEKKTGNVSFDLQNLDKL